MRRLLSALVVAFLATPALAAPLTDAFQNDAGQSGDAPGALGLARLLPAAGTYAGMLVPVDDMADAYAIQLDQDVHLHARADALPLPDAVDLHLVAPDGTSVALASWSGARVLTDVAGPWKLRVSGSLTDADWSNVGDDYDLRVTTTRVYQDDGGAGRDAGFRPASGVDLARNVTKYGNLTAAHADCTDTWNLPVVEGERLNARVSWTSGQAVYVTFPSTATDVVHSTTANSVNRTATVTANGTWTFAVRYAQAPNGDCLGTSALYSFLLTEVAVEPSAEEPPPEPSPPELFDVRPYLTRPGKTVEVYGRNLSGAAFALGGLEASVTKYEPDGTKVTLKVPLLPPGTYDLAATRDGVTDVLVNATEVLAPADLAVASVRVKGRAPPDGYVTLDPPLDRRTVEVEVVNLGANVSEDYVVHVHVFPRGLPPTVGAYGIGHVVAPALEPGARAVHAFTWDARANVGSFDVRAVVVPNVAGNTPKSYYDADPENDVGWGRDHAFVDPGVGWRPPTRLP